MILLRRSQPALLRASHITRILHPLRVSKSVIVRSGAISLASTTPSNFHTSLRHLAAKSNVKPCHSKVGETQNLPPRPLSLMEFRFWTSKPAWRRAAVNTFRCLVGCTTGDFAAMWFLQTWYAGIGIGPIMAISMASGITTSMLLETTLLRMGKDKMSWPVAAKTAAGMSLISMLTMELAENMADYHLTGGLVALDDPKFWIAAVVATSAGFLAPLPYNYLRLRRYGKACH